MPPLLANFIHPGVCKPICVKSLTLPKRSQGVLRFIQRENMNTLHCTNSPRAKRGQACGIKKIRRKVQDIQKSNYAGGTGAVVMTSSCEIITKLLADASLNMLGSNWMQYVKKGREDS